jgi:hypothetical protein
MSARDRECKDGMGKFCREREAAVNERRQTLDTAMLAIGLLSLLPQIGGILLMVGRSATRN